ncbi:unnamed protein product [Closterium sp. NIES-53]
MQEDNSRPYPYVSPPCVLPLRLTPPPCGGTPELNRAIDTLLAIGALHPTPVMYPPPAPLPPLFLPVRLTPPPCSGTPELNRAIGALLESGSVAAGEKMNEAGEKRKTDLPYGLPPVALPLRLTPPPCSGTPELNRAIGALHPTPVIFPPSPSSPPSPSPYPYVLPLLLATVHPS